MSKERNIHIEDENAQQDVNTENVEQGTQENNKEQQTDKESEAADKDTANADNKAEEKELDPLAKAQQEVEDLKKQLLYKTAEFENYRKRTLKKTIAAILPVLDDFERALADKSEDPKAIKEGVQMIFNKFVKSLESLGVKKIETQDKDFDVDYHEAIAMVPGMGDDKKGKVIDCVQTGYTLNDKVIRHAKVAVGQ